MNTNIRAAVRKMSAYTPGEQPKQEGVIKLNTNENPYPPSPEVARALAAFNPDSLSRYPDPACSELRGELASLHGCNPDSIFVANGSDEALRMAIDAFVELDGSIGFFDPSYSLYPVLAAARGIKTKPVDIWPELSWKMPAGYQASLFFITNPNAPTSMAFDKAKIRSFCERFRGVVVIDEAYADFADSNCMDIAMSLPNVLVCRTLSKSYSLAGLRIGYLVGSRELIDALNKIKDSYNVDRIAQILAAAAVRDQEWMLGNAAKIRDTRARLSGELCALGWNVRDSQSNFLWAAPPPGGKPAKEIFEALRDRLIFVRYWGAPRIGDSMRITIGTDAQIDALLKAIKEICK